MLLLYCRAIITLKIIYIYTCIINLYGFMFVRNADLGQVMDFYDAQFKYINMIILTNYRVELEK